MGFLVRAGKGPGAAFFFSLLRLGLAAPPESVSYVSKMRCSCEERVQHRETSPEERERYTGRPTHGGERARAKGFPVQGFGPHGYLAHEKQPPSLGPP